MMTTQSTPSLLTPHATIRKTRRRARASLTITATPVGEPIAFTLIAQAIAQAIRHGFATGRYHRVNGKIVKTGNTP